MENENREIPNFAIIIRPNWKKVKRAEIWWYIYPKWYSIGLKMKSDIKLFDWKIPLNMIGQCTSNDSMSSLQSSNNFSYLFQLPHYSQINNNKCIVKESKCYKSIKCVGITVRTKASCVIHVFFVCQRIVSVTGLVDFNFFTFLSFVQFIRIRMYTITRAFFNCHYKHRYILVVHGWYFSRLHSVW